MGAVANPARTGEPVTIRRMERTRNAGGGSVTHSNILVESQAILVPESGGRKLEGGQLVIEQRYRLRMWHRKGYTPQVADEILISGLRLSLHSYKIDGYKLIITAVANG